MIQIDYKAAVLKVYPDAEILYYIDPYCDSYYYIGVGCMFLCEPIPHNSDACWEQAYTHIQNLKNEKK